MAERSLESIAADDRQSGGFVSRAVRLHVSLSGSLMLPDIVLATWFQLGYQPKVHKQSKKISFGTMISSQGHYLTTSVTTISILAWFKGTLLDCFTVD